MVLLSCREDSVSPSPSLLGEWQFVGFANAQGELVVPEPADQTDPIVIRFGADTLSGWLFGPNDGPGDLFARYRVLNDSVLLFSDLTYIEEVGDGWEVEFVNNFPRDTARYAVRENALVLFPESINNQGPFTDDTPTVYRRKE